MPAIVIKDKAEKLAELGDIQSAAKAARDEIKQLNAEAEKAIAAGKMVPESRIARLKQVKELSKDYAFQAQQQRMIDKSIGRVIRVRGQLRDVGDLVSLAGGNVGYQELKAVHDVAGDLGEKLGKNSIALKSFVSGLVKVGGIGANAYMAKMIAESAGKSLGMSDSTAAMVGNVAGTGSAGVQLFKWVKAAGGVSASIKALSTFAGAAGSGLSGIGAVGAAGGGAAAFAVAGYMNLYKILSEGAAIGNSAGAAMKVLGKDNTAKLERIFARSMRLSISDTSGYAEMYGTKINPFVQNIAALQKLPPTLVTQLYNSAIVAAGGHSRKYATDSLEALGALSTADSMAELTFTMPTAKRIVADIKKIAEAEERQEKNSKNSLYRMRQKQRENMYRMYEEERQDAIANYALL